jgi:hypothetical protein
MWDQFIEESIKNITKTYGINELAFLAMQGKIELQLRDKIAWYLEQNIPNNYCVKREYNIPGNGRQKCDLAILDTNNMKPVCLIEFKAHSAATFEMDYINKCTDDIAKMQSIAQGITPDPEIYYIFFQTEHQGTPPPNNGLIAYYGIIKKALKDNLGVNDIHNQWNNNYSNIGTIKKITIAAGKYYGLKVDIHTMILKY